MSRWRGGWRKLRRKDETMSKIEITEELLCKIEAAAEEALAIHPAPWTIERDQVRDANRALVGAPDVPRGVPVILYVGTLAPEVALALCAELRKEWEEAHRAWMNRREETERSDRLFTAFRWRMRCPLCGGTWDNTGYMDCPRPGTFRCPRCFGEIPYEDLEQWKVGTMKIRKREPGPGTIHFGDEVAKLKAEREAMRTDMASGFAEIANLRARLALSRSKEQIREAVHSACSCGGGGADDGCPACKVWHELDLPADDPKEAGL